MMLKAVNITKNYRQISILKGIDLSVKKGEVVSVVGASGAGKSTLLHILGTLDRADSGEVWINQTKLSELKTDALASFRNKEIGFIFQFHNLLPEFSALENICIPGMIGGSSKKKLKQKAKQLLNLLGLENRSTHKPSELSGGEQQRVAVARALINDPSIIFADEPGGNLDSKNATQLHELFFYLRDKFNQTFVIVTHNRSFAGLADKTLEIVDGKIA